ncbi:MAG: DUF4041 domain-containing protein [Chitinophagaceae bacterium]|nr:MAG: DUF4041 domain-containing protein [Chitinophagaceae bacterium]
MALLTAILGILALVAYYLLIKTRKQLKETEQSSEAKISELANSLNKYTPLIDLDAEREKRLGMVNSLKEDLEGLKSKYEKGKEVFQSLEKEIQLYNDSLELHEHGLYEPMFNFDDSEGYKNAIAENYRKQKNAVQNETAVTFSNDWTVNGSVVEGRKMTKKYIKLMLFAFNGECDSIISKVKWNNAEKSKERIRKSFEMVNKQGETQRISIKMEFLDLKLEELALTYEHELKKYEEKEEQRMIREQMKEEERARKEYERAQREAEDEEKQYQRYLDKARKELAVATGDELKKLNEKIAKLELDLVEAEQRRQRAISMAQMTKAGHIYVISNIGSFGDDVYKIGMTRRLEPMDRVKELGDASVPFQFDVHAIIYSENAPQLEAALHRKFTERRVNQVNGRKEFFQVPLQQIEDFINENTEAEIEFTKVAEAKEFRETIAVKEGRAAAKIEISQKEHFPADLFE